MADNRCSSGYGKETVCIDVNRVLDSCKDKDCFSDVKVYLTDFGQDIIDRAGAIRVKSTKTVGVNIDTEPVTFNRGFYQILIRFYVKLVFEACVNVGRSVEFEGIAVCDKKVILYGSEASSKEFSSRTCANGCDTICEHETYEDNKCAVCGCPDHEHPDEAFTDTLVTPGTCVAGAVYTRTYACGATTTITGEVDPNAHTWAPDGSGKCVNDGCDI